MSASMLFYSLLFTAVFFSDKQLMTAPQCSMLFDTVRIDITPSTISLLPRTSGLFMFCCIWLYLLGSPSLVFGATRPQMACRTLSDIVYGGVPLMGVLWVQLFCQQFTAIQCKASALQRGDRNPTESNNSATSELDDGDQCEANDLPELRERSTL